MFISVQISSAIFFVTYGSRSILLGPNREDKYPIQLCETVFWEMKKYRISKQYVGYLAKAEVF